MANTNSKVAVLRGKANYAKILGDPVPNFGKDGFEWKMDLVIDKATVKELKSLGIADKVKQKDDYVDGESYLTFKQKATRIDRNSGEEVKNDPIDVRDILDESWDQSKLIGNGSTVDVKFAVVDYGAGKKKGMYIRSVRVMKHVPYETQAFEKIDESDEFYQASVDAKRAAEERAVRAAADDTQFKTDFEIPTDELDDDVVL